eukprot:GHVP01066267.1.p1 GENE.GHVP01066267.1~~GHVP01066267.1.p1  ORF type:complete len:379 (-),score=29.36 GHVP01066267.1:1049-2137(-)
MPHPIRIFNFVSRLVQGVYALFVIFFVSIFYAPVESCRYDLYVWLIVWGNTQFSLTLLSLILDLISIHRFNRGDPSLFAPHEKVAVFILLVFSLFNLGWVFYGICPVFLWKYCPEGSSIDYFGYISWTLTMITNVLPLIFLLVLSVMYFVCADGIEGSEEEAAGVPEDAFANVKVLKWKDKDDITGRNAEHTTPGDEERIITSVKSHPPTQTSSSVKINIGGIGHQRSSSFERPPQLRSCSQDSVVTHVSAYSQRGAHLAAHVLNGPVSNVIFGGVEEPAQPKQPLRLPEFENMCSICYCEYADEDDVAFLPCDDRHAFHFECIKTWFQRSRDCPTCRADVVTLLLPKKEELFDALDPTTEV